MIIWAWEGFLNKLFHYSLLLSLNDVRDGWFENLFEAHWKLFFRIKSLNIMQPKMFNFKFELKKNLVNLLVWLKFYCRPRSNFSSHFPAHAINPSFRFYATLKDWFSISIKSFNVTYYHEAFVLCLISSHLIANYTWRLIPNWFFCYGEHSTEIYRVSHEKQWNNCLMKIYIFDVR